MSIAKASLRVCGLFEAELLVELMLRFWNHPLAADKDFRNQLLETAVEVLRVAATGQTLMEDISGPNMNLVAAVWYAECSAVTPSERQQIPFARKRKAWLETVRAPCRHAFAILIYSCNGARRVRFVVFCLAA